MELLESLKRTVRREPVRAASVVSAGLAILVAFGLDLSAEQVGAISAFVSIVLGGQARAKVTPVTKDSE